MSFAEAVSESWLTRGKYLDLTRATCLLLYLYLTHVWTKIHTHTPLSQHLLSAVFPRGGAAALLEMFVSGVFGQSQQNRDHVAHF